MNPLEQVVGSWAGRSTFRLMPTDAFASGESSATSTSEADGWGWLLRYAWVHPDDGAQSGVLLLGSPDADGSVSAAWLDSWHQKPGFGLATGPASGGGVDLEMEYDGWGWTIALRPDGDRLEMLMHNVVPDGIEGASPGPYLVMEASWNREADAATTGR